MRKKLFSIMLYILVLFICGCTQRQQTVTVQSMMDYNILESTAETEKTVGEETYKKITIDVIRQVSEKHEALSLEDFSSFMDIMSGFAEGKSLWKELRF